MGREMSSEMSLGALEAVQQATKQDAAIQTQAMAAASQAMMAQRFELGLIRASELNAATFQATEESRRKTIVAQRENLSTSDIPEVEVQPGGKPDNLAKEVVSYLDGFSLRAKSYTSDLDNAVSKIDGNLPVAPSETASGQAVPTEGKTTLDPASALRFMQRTFEFALETHLISNASTASTKVLNDLMKGQ